MEKLKDEQLLAEFLKWSDVRMTERAIRLLGQFSQIVTGDLIFRDVEGKDLNRELDK